MRFGTSLFLSSHFYETFFIACVAGVLRGGRGGREYGENSGKGGGTQAFLYPSPPLPSSVFFPEFSSVFPILSPLCACYAGYIPQGCVYC